MKMFYLTYGTNKVLRIMEIHVTPPDTEPGRIGFNKSESESE